MVFLNIILRCNATFQAHRYKFVDALRIYVRGGAGGNGFHRFKGIGGNGGNVYVFGEESQTLHKLKKKFSNQRFVGGTGGNSRLHAIQGSPGEHFRIPVPLGVTVSNEYGKILGEINKEGEEVIVAYGGKGGDTETQYNGVRGEGKIIILDYKLIADVALVGFPNAGKSTLLKAISRANPEISAYPFTTIRPQIGIIQFPDLRQISVADLPGLVEGAHINIGMGHRFLKHVERTKLLLMMVDINGFRLTYQHDFRKAFESIILLNKELELYKEELLDKPVLLVVNKMDTEDSQDNLKTFLSQILNNEEAVQQLPPEFRPKRLIEFEDIIPISAEDGFNIERLKQKIRALLDIYDDMAKESQFQPFPKAEGFNAEFV